MVDLEGCRELIEVPVRRLDDQLQDSGVTSWDLLKIDVEGYEPFVFDGAAQTLSRTEMLAMEFLPAAWKKSGVDANALFQKLRANFPRVYHFQGLELSPMDWEQCAKSHVALDLLLQR